MTLATALKLHLRVFEIHRTTLRVITLRPQTQARFSTNYFHDTWHILAGTDGAVLLGRLLWGLAFQRHPGTLILIDPSHLVPTPFEADPPDPILLVPDGLTRIDDDALRALKLRLRRAPGSPTTIRWHTFGMTGALADPDSHRSLWRALWCNPDQRRLWTRERMTRRAGFICYTAPPDLLRAHALGIYRMSAHHASYYPLAEGDRQTRGYDGEFQLIPGFADAVSAARVARRERLGHEADLIATDDDRWAIYRRKEHAVQRLRGARSRPPRRVA